MENNIVIGIEGLVGSGKTTICREMLKLIPNSILLNGGNLYRAIVYVMMKDTKNIMALKEKSVNINIKMMMDKLGIKMTIEDGETQFYCNGKKISEEEMQSKEASLAVSNVGGVANNEKLFEFARELINKLKKEHIIIISGRSIMKIYPETDYHFFITADLEERVKRKSNQYKNESIDIIRENIEKRDELQRKAGFYDKTEKTIEIDVTNCKNVEDEIKQILKYINGKELIEYGV